MKRIVACLVCVCILCLQVVALAYEYPSSFWSVNDKYVKALESKNYPQIIEYGKQIVKIIEPTEESKEKMEILVSRYSAIASAYAEMGDYENSAKAYADLYNYAEKNKNKWPNLNDFVRGAKAKSLQYKSEIKMYTTGGTSPYYGAVNEKRNGVLFGVCSNGETRSKLSNESMVLTYQELGQSLLAYNTSVVSKAAKEGIAVEFALNCPKEGNDIRNIRNLESYLKEISDMFKKYPDVPIYLRFAAEFDIWTTMAEPDEFISAFRYVSQYFKSRNKNVAIVWSPNYASKWDVCRDDYYPGDEYVDWVGISLYAQKYFRGDKNAPEEDQIIFMTGVNSDPVYCVKEIVEKYGSRKPIMISESGCGHKLVKSGENTSEFALKRLKEYYSYLPMVYPQIKLIAHFDWLVDSTSERSDYRLSSNTKLQNEYLSLTKGQRFIQDSYSNNVDTCYREIVNGSTTSGVFEVSCYAHMYKADIQKVTYFIDGKYVGESNEIPFSEMIDASEYSGGHTLKAIAQFNNGKTLTTESKININSSNVKKNITVRISNKNIEFDQSPILYNGRTMVPLRKIFEELGATVSWNNDTQTATGVKGDRTVKVTIGQNKMYVNSKEIVLDTAPMVLSGRTLVPARAIAEGLGCTVDWDGVKNIVSITPKEFKWSSWVDELPDSVDSDMYYIEEKDMYAYKTREKEYYTTDYELRYGNYVNCDISYGSWSNWSTDYALSSDSLEVETRTSSSPKRYFYAHYCTGNESDSSIRYKTSRSKFSDRCSYHELGWYDEPLPSADDGVGYILYKSDGNKYRCSNTCYRWYVFEESGGTYTEYRTRPIYKTYTYWDWGQWSDWSRWSETDPRDYYGKYNESIKVKSKVVYRYKEK